MNHHLTGGVLTTAAAWGTLDYTESAADPMQNMTITYDKPVTFKSLVLRNNTGVATPTVVVTRGTSNVGLTATTEGSGLDALIRVTFASDCAIDNAGINVKVYKNPVQVGTRALAPRIPTSIGLMGTSAGFSLTKSDIVRFDLFDVKGRHVATLASGYMNAGRYAARIPMGWSGAGILRLSTSDNTLVQRVIVSR